jgi:glutathione S-transferase
MAITFYYAPMSSATRCQIALEEVGVPYEKVHVQTGAGENKTPAFLAINPNGKIPALVDGEQKIFESLAILLHLGETYGVAKGLWPKPDTADHGDALSWTVWGSTELAPAVMDHAIHTSDAFRIAFPPEKRSPHVAAVAHARWAHAVGMLDERLAARDFMLGASYTLVDVAIVAMVMMGTMMGNLSLEPFANVGRWVSRCQQRPAFAKVLSGA